MDICYHHKARKRGQCVLTLLSLSLCHFYIIATVGLQQELMVIYVVFTIHHQNEYIDCVLFRMVLLSAIIKR